MAIREVDGESRMKIEIIVDMTGEPMDAFKLFRKISWELETMFSEEIKEVQMVVKEDDVR